MILKPQARFPKTKDMEGWFIEDDQLLRVVAVELAAGPGLGPALEAGKPIPVPRPAQTLADEYAKHENGDVIICLK